VTSVPHEATGEKLVVIHTPLEKSPEDLVQGLRAAGLPRLFIPSAGDFHEIENMPLIGIGKVDLEAIDRLARERFARASAKKR
jgi:acyl-[acyl-carrier-protein]-phospholipid O-acyltransferase/long-chain-fatty-acid--[acyl-carrier-protein] ligase